MRMLTGKAYHTDSWGRHGWALGNGRLHPLY